MATGEVVNSVGRAQQAHEQEGMAPDRLESEVAPMEALRDEVVEGLLYAHSRANANTSKVLEVASFSYALIELLMERGLLSVEELDERKRIVGQRLVDKFLEKEMGVALTKEADDKYSYQSTISIDCENRLHLCWAACCRLRFALSAQDVEEGTVKWELGRPYIIRHDRDGYCHHLHRSGLNCGVYTQRPLVCRAYDCRSDKRIWADFENRIVSPELAGLFSRQADGGDSARDAAVPAADGEPQVAAAAPGASSR
jgi:Fe-S-cluster containining protein